MAQAELNFLLTMSFKDERIWGGTLYRAIEWGNLGRATVTGDIKAALVTLENMAPPPTDVICSSFKDEGSLWLQVRDETVKRAARFHLLTADGPLGKSFRNGDLTNVYSLIEADNFDRNGFIGYFSTLQSR